MNKEDRELLLRDLLVRLPYEVKVEYESKIFDIDYISSMYEEVKLYNPPENWGISDYNKSYTIDISDIKPYLFPISSMTEEQCLRLFEILGIGVNSNYGGDYVKINSVTGITFFFETGRDIETVVKAIDYLNSIHVDYRGLILKGLAKDATNLNIY